MKTPLLLAVSGALLIVSAACGTVGTASDEDSRIHAAASSSTTTSAPARPADPGNASGDFCTQLRNLIRWQLANADRVDVPSFLTESARRYMALESVAPPAYRDTVAFFAKYAAEPPAQAADEAGFAGQAQLLSRAATSCHIDVAAP